MPGLLNAETVLSLASWLGEDDPAPLERRSTLVSQIIDDFDVNGTVRRVISVANKEQYNVALQFPDSLLRFAPLVCEALRLYTEEVLSEGGHRESTEIFYFLLGDTSYGECCVDEVAAEHLSSDLVVHYGDACLSPTRTLPVSYVFPAYRIDRVELAIVNFEKAVQDVLDAADVNRVVLLYDVDLGTYFKSDMVQFGAENVAFDAFGRQADICRAHLRIHQREEILRPDNQSWACTDSELTIGALAYERGAVPLRKTAFLWFTKGEIDENWPPSIRNAALQLSTGAGEHCAGFYTASLTSDTGEGATLVNATRVLRKRFAVLSKLKDAERIGIVPGTLSVSGNLEVIERCKRIIKCAKKQSYVMLVGKPNPAKLANFPDIDVFVLVACPQNSLLDGRDYLRPIVTPLELEAALLADGDIFSAPYSVDYRDLLGKQLRVEEEDDDKLNGRGEKSLSVRGDWSVSVVGDGRAADYLRNRHWQGLKYSEGGVDDETDIADLPTAVQPGQTGIARRYDKEVDPWNKN